MRGSPIRTSSDQRSVGSSPRLIAASYVLHRLLVPRHPPCALNNLATQNLQTTNPHHHTPPHQHPPPPPNPSTPQRPNGTRCRRPRRRNPTPQAGPRPTGRQPPEQMSPFLQDPTACL